MGQIKVCGKRTRLLNDNWSFFRTFARRRVKDIKPVKTLNDRIMQNGHHRVAGE